MKDPENYHHETIFYICAIVFCFPFIAIHYASKALNATDIFSFFDLGRFDMSPFRIIVFSVISWVGFFWLVFLGGIYS